jgi:hypothetical protein
MGWFSPVSILPMVHTHHQGLVQVALWGHSSSGLILIPLVQLRKNENIMVKDFRLLIHVKDKLQTEIQGALFLVEGFHSYGIKSWILTWSNLYLILQILRLFFTIRWWCFFFLFIFPPSSPHHIQIALSTVFNYCYTSWFCNRSSLMLFGFNLLVMFMKQCYMDSCILFCRVWRFHII